MLNESLHREKHAQQVLWHLTLILLSVSLIWLVRTVDRAFPVVTDFQVTSQTVAGDSVIIAGTMDKVRDCEFLDIRAYTSEGRHIRINFLDRADSSPPETRPTTFQIWGPRQVFTNNATTVNIYAHHACSIFWSQTTKLVTLTVIKVPESLENNDENK